MLIIYIISIFQNYTDVVYAGLHIASLKSILNMIINAINIKLINIE